MQFLKTFFLAFCAICCFSAAQAQTARVQIIHNSPEPMVDIYAGTNLLLDNFEFRTATSFLDLPANTDITIGVAPATSTSSADAIATFNVNFAENETYVVMAAGVVGNMGNTAFNLFINGTAQEAASSMDNVAASIFHGSPDAPAVDVDAVFVADNLVTGLEFGQFTDYLEVPAGKYDFAIRAANDPNVVASFRADLSALGGGAATVFASGFLGDMPAFGLYAALPTGDIVALPATPTARIQVIHNSPAPTVDVYAGNTRLLDNFEFRTATSFIDIPADREIALGVALDNSQSAADAIATFPVNLTENGTFVAFATGVVGNMGATAFDIRAFDGALETSNNMNEVALRFFHGSTDAPEVDLTLPNGDVFIDDAEYGDYVSVDNLPAAQYLLNITPADDNSTIVATVNADVSGLGGQSVTVWASGFFDNTDPAFEVWAALADGTTFPLAFTTSTNTLESAFNTIALFPNPATSFVNLQLDSKERMDVRYRIVNVLGKTVQEGNVGTFSGAFGTELNVGDLTTGQYYLQLISEKGQTYRTFSVK